ncbi:CASP-like protein 2D1 [Typha latifolia]|uniref:CASP-like protein 2D1 n=1 Tax=Typha latifolia TaxID=4733 RepID=UPI003C2FCABC
MRNGADINSTTSKMPKLFIFLELSFRLCVIPLSAATIGVMASNKQSNETYGGVAFSNLTGFKYLVCINAISVGYALFSILLSCFRHFNTDWILFLLDQLVAYLMVTSGSAVAEIFYVANEGDREVSWSEVCSYYDKFCNKTKVSLALHAMSLLCFIALSLISAFRLFTKFEAPTLSPKEVDQQGE